MSYLVNKIDDRIVELLKKGGVGLLPSDTIYGLSCRALDQKAVARIRNLKGREANKPFIVLVSDEKMLNMLSIRYTKAIKPVLNKYWPGSLTVIFEAPSAPDWLAQGKDTLAVRQPAVDQLRELIDKTGPLVSTSANPAGDRPAASVTEAQRYFGDRLDFYVDVGPLAGEPSTIVKTDAQGIQIVRQGIVTVEP